MLPPWIRLVSFGDAFTLFDDRTGHDLALPAVGDPALLERHPRLLRSGFLDALDPAARIPHRKLHPLFLPDSDTLLCPDPTRHPPGGWPWRTFRVEPRSLALWRAVDGRATVTQIAERTQIPVDEAMLRLGGLAAWPIQAVLLRKESVRRDHPSLCRVVGRPREPNERDASMYAGASTALGDFHDAIEDTATRFDLAETTLAHAFGLPHPALGGQRWGERLFDHMFPASALGGKFFVTTPGMERARAGAGRRRVLPKAAGERVVLDRGPVSGGCGGSQPPTMRCVEVGGGTGELGAAFLDRARERGYPIEYRRIDRSPALLALQADKMPGAVGLVGDALALPLADGSVDLLIANEVIADLPSRRTAHGWENDGALRFVEEVARVLAAGGEAFISEFGTEADAPEEAVQLDHPEVSIRFDRLVERALSLRLSARLTPVADFLGLDLDARWLWRPHLGALRVLDQRAGRPPTPARAWTPETLPLGEKVEGLRWVNLREEGPGPLPSRTWVLTLRRP